MKRLITSGRVGGTDADMAGAEAHRHHGSDRIELHATDTVVNGMPEIGTIKIRHRQPIIEEREVKLAFVQHLSDLLVIRGDVKSVRESG